MTEILKFANTHPILAILVAYAIINSVVRIVIALCIREGGP